METCANARSAAWRWRRRAHADLVALLSDVFVKGEGREGTENQGAPSPSPFAVQAERLSFTAWFLHISVKFSLLL